jgi:glycosyltransferase involved in cell wall biosynthesis
MRVFHVVQSLDPAQGGLPVVASSLGAAQAQLGTWVGLVCYGHDTSTADGRVPMSVDDMSHFDLMHPSTLPRPSAIELFTARGAARELNRLLQRGDVLHLHGVWNSVLRVAASVARRRGNPYVITPHGMLDPWSLDQRRWKKKLAMMLTYRRMLNEAAFLHALNGDEAQLIEPLGLTCPVQIIPNGVFMEELEPLPAPGSFHAAFPQVRGRPYILFLSRLHYKKGLDLLADAFARVANQFADLQLVVAGPDDGAAGDFQRQVAAAGLNDRVHMVGPVYGTQKLAAFADCRVFCLPSRQEGFSMAITEALACRAPVVITEGCHFPLVAEAGAGLVVKTDAPSVAGGLERVLADAVMSKQMGLAGRSLVESRFTWPRIAGRTLDAYRRAVERPLSLRVTGKTDRKLRCLHYLARASMEGGGLSQSVLDMCGLLSSRGHQITLATCDASEVPQRWSEGESSMPHLCTLEPKFGLRGMLGSGAMEKIETIVASCDLVHLHSPWELGNLQVAKVCRKLNRPYMVTIHGMLDDWSMAQRALKKRLFLSLFGRRFLEDAASVHFTALPELIQASKWFNDRNWAVAPCMFDLSPYEQLPGPQAARDAFDAVSVTEPNILFLSRVHPKKGPELLIEAMALLRHQGVSARVLLAGPPEPGYQAMLDRMVRRLGLADRVFFLGVVRGIEKLSLYQASDVLVLPTSQENFGLVLLEAMACGIPVITTRGVDIWEQLENGGALIVERTAQAIADALQSLLADRNRLEALGSKGRRWVFDYQQSDHVARQYEQMYEEAIAASASQIAAA